MPPKSRRNRRNIPQNRAGLKKPAVAPPVVPPATAQPERPARSTYTSPAPPPTASSYPYISGEIKRIATIAGIIIVLLIIAALFFR